MPLFVFILTVLARIRISLLNLEKSDGRLRLTLIIRETGNETMTSKSKKIVFSFGIEQRFYQLPGS